MSFAKAYHVFQKATGQLPEQKRAALKKMKSMSVGNNYPSKYTTLRELGIYECDHHQTRTSSGEAGIDDVSRMGGFPDRTRYNSSCICILCGAEIIDGEWRGGSTGLVIDIEKIDLVLLAIRYFRKGNKSLSQCEAGYMKCKAGHASLTHHNWHCPKCDYHLTSLYLCPECGIRYDPPDQLVNIKSQAD